MVDCNSLPYIGQSSQFQEVVFSGTNDQRIMSGRGQRENSHFPCLFFALVAKDFPILVNVIFKFKGNEERNIMGVYCLDTRITLMPNKYYGCFSFS